MTPQQRRAGDAAMGVAALYGAWRCLGWAQAAADEALEAAQLGVRLIRRALRPVVIDVEPPHGPVDVEAVRARLEEDPTALGVDVDEPLEPPTP